jgi:hypothetical protein
METYAMIEPLTLQELQFTVTPVFTESEIALGRALGWTDEELTPVPEFYGLTDEEIAALPLVDDPTCDMTEAEHDAYMAPFVAESNAREAQWEREWESRAPQRAARATYIKACHAARVIAEMAPIGSRGDIYYAVFPAQLQSAKMAVSAEHAGPRVRVTSRVVKLDAAAIPDIPETVLDGRLGELAEKMVHGEPAYPRSYAYPSLLTVASAMYPAGMAELSQGNHLYTSGPRQQTNLYTALIGAIHSGKSQAIATALQMLGIPTNKYSEVKSGSPEALTTHLSKQALGSKILIDLDEWEHLLRKAGIEGSTFYTLLNSGFYKNSIDLVVAKGKHRQINCEISFIGGIVEDMYGELLGANANGGFADRLLQGRCPSNFQFHYCEPDIKPAKIEFKPVRIDRSVWETTREWATEFPGVGRELEIAIRCARICASADGRSALYGRDLGPAKALMLEQMKIRKALSPNPGTNPDAIAAFAIANALPANGDWVSVRDLDRRIHADRLGPGVFKRALENLHANQKIELLQPSTLDDYKRVGWEPQKPGRKPKLVRLLQDF